MHACCNRCLTRCALQQAYIFGFFFGRTPLIKLSPKKTWEGAQPRRLPELRDVCIDITRCALTLRVSQVSWGRW